MGKFLAVIVTGIVFVAVTESVLQVAAQVVRALR